MRLLGTGLLVVMLTASARAQNLNEYATLMGIGVVNTHAQSTTRLPNTVADVTVGVEVTGKDATDVTTRLSQQSNQLLGYLRNAGAERLVTGDVSFEPQNHTAKSGVESIVGYTGSTTVSFRTTPDKLGTLISGALGNGANKVESANLHPSEAEAETARRTLAETATKQALTEAQAVAQASEEHVVSIKEITVSQPGLPIRPYMMAAEQRVAVNVNGLPPIAISAGDAEISVTVNVAVNISK